MKAWVQTAFGGAGVRQLRDVPKPRPTRSDVVLQVLACALNRLDVLQRAAPVVGGFSLPHIGGMDIVGRVTGAASLQGEALLGTTVVVDPVVTCEAYGLSDLCDMCAAAQPMYCRRLRTIGSSRDGGFAEFVAVPACNCIDIGDGAPGVVEMAAVPVASVTAWHGLLGAGRIRAGETVVVPGAGSGLGGAGIRIAKREGCRVITTVGSAAKMDAARAIGADIVIDRSRSEWVAEVRTATGGAGADLVWDHVGGPFLQESIDACRVGGRVVLSGTTASAHSTISNASVFHWGRTLIGHGGYSRAEMRQTVAAYRAGELAVSIDSVWAFADLPAAEARLESAEFFGKIVVCM